MEREIRVDGTRLEKVSEFKYLRCILNESNTDDSEYCRKVASRRKVAGAIRSPILAVCSLCVQGCYIRDSHGFSVVW